MAFAQTRTGTYTEDDYYNIPEDIRAELIDGQIYYMAAPSRTHQAILSELHLVIGNYIKKRGGSCHIYPAPFAVKLFDDKKTIVEPDLSVICSSSKLTDMGCTGAPDWIIEITSPSTSSHDHVRKLNLYANAGVREYWIVDSSNQKVFVYHLEETSFKADCYTFQDEINANIFEDLSITLADLDIS